MSLFSHLAFKELLDEGLPEVFLHPFSIKYHTMMQFTQLLYEAEWTSSWLIILTVKIF